MVVEVELQNYRFSQPTGFSPMYGLELASLIDKRSMAADGGHMSLDSYPFIFPFHIYVLIAISALCFLLLKLKSKCCPCRQQGNITG